MKKFIITLSLLVAFLLTGEAQVLSADSNHQVKNHLGHHSDRKGDRHRKGIRLFHGHHHHGKDHAQSGTHSHHGRKDHGKEKKDK